MKDAKTQFFWPIYSAVVHELQLVGCQPMMGEERNSAPFSSAYGWKKSISSGSQQNLGQSGDDHHTSRVMESEERGLLDTSRERRYRKVVHPTGKQNVYTRPRFANRLSHMKSGNRTANSRKRTSYSR
jgi:hypothetical protein